MPVSSYFEFSVTRGAFGDDFVGSGSVMGVVTNITRRQVTRDVGNFSFLEPFINIPFWFDALSQDTPRVLHEDTTRIFDIICERWACPPTHGHKLDNQET
jgi:hypothetical protein